MVATHALSVQELYDFGCSAWSMLLPYIVMMQIIFAMELHSSDPACTKGLKTAMRLVSNVYSDLLSSALTHLQLSRNSILSPKANCTGAVVVLHIFVMQMCPQIVCDALRV